MAPLEFSDFLDRSLGLLWRDVPTAYAALGRKLANGTLHLIVDGSETFLSFVGGAHRLARRRSGSAGSPAETELRTTGAAILALIDGETTLENALRSDALFLRGPIEAVARFDGALMAYLAGAVRSPDFPMLLARYRRSVAAPTPTRGFS